MGKFDIDRPIAELFSVEPYALRIRNVCNSHDIATIRELCQHSNWDLLHFRHLGERSIVHIEDMLGKFGLRLGMTEEDLDAYMRFETEDDKDVTTIMRFEESEEVKWDLIDAGQITQLAELLFADQHFIFNFKIFIHWKVHLFPV